MRALSHRLRDPVERAERGVLLETLILHELRAWLNDSNCGGDIYYWRTPSQAEVDFIWSRGRTAVGFEVKAGEQWRREFSSPLKELHRNGVIQKCFGIYLGDIRLKDGPVLVLPFTAFIKALNEGRVVR